jgi:hypothetical protein
MQPRRTLGRSCRNERGVCITRQSMRSHGPMSHGNFCFRSGEAAWHIMIPGLRAMRIPVRRVHDELRIQSNRHAAADVPRQVAKAPAGSHLSCYIDRDRRQRDQHSCRREVTSLAKARIKSQRGPGDFSSSRSQIPTRTSRLIRLTARRLPPSTDY